MLKAIGLISVGEHPYTKRARRADQDAKMVELALGLDTVNFELLHAGDPDEPSLRDYLGMGIPELIVLSQPANADVIPALVDYIRSTNADVILTGTEAEVGECSGHLPYTVANLLGFTLVPKIVEVLRIDNNSATVLQALPRGQRRKVEVNLPFVGLIDSAAAEPRQISYLKSVSGNVYYLGAPFIKDTALENWEFEPAAKRPKRLKKVKATSAKDRFKAATAKSETKSSQVMHEPDPNEAAEEILKVLKAEGLLKKRG